MKFDVFMGVDQTGAKRNKRGTRARPLSAALLFEKREGSKKWTLVPLELESLTRAEVARVLAAELGADRAARARLALLVDSVFGLPARCDHESGIDSIWRLMQSTHEIDGFGRDRSEPFFKRLLPRKTPGVEFPPRRRCEELAGANSVFLTLPHQKNVQTGTFRVWKDLTSENSRWFKLWPFESRQTSTQGMPWIFECYPTHFWRTMLNTPKRLPKILPQLLASRSIEISDSDRSQLRADGDLADATVLACGGLWLQEKRRLFEPHARFQAVPDLGHEGWIAGLAKGV
jgi:hypothetical protein